MVSANDSTGGTIYEINVDVIADLFCLDWRVLVQKT